jgi:hypothetical protein
MAEPSRDDDVLAHIASIATRTHRDAQQLTETLRARAWPGGTDDRSEPGALAWLKRWRPGVPAPIPAVCGCARGRCLVCN